MVEIKGQQFTVEPDPGNPAAELGLRKFDQFSNLVAQIAFGNDSNTYLSFQSNPGGTMAEQMRIHTNGNIGIGTATPGEKLEVAGTVKATAFDGNLNGSQIATGTVADARLPLSISRTADVDARFDPITGHKHTGAAGDGTQISHSTLTEITGADPGSTDAQTNKHVSNAQTRQWQDHLGMTSGNPHGTTATQVGAPVSVEGVSNPGGDIDLVTSNAITITGNNTTKQITIGESHSARADNPHATTAAQVGSPVSVEGVSNPGGNIDLVKSNAITITGNNTTKQITIGESHSTRTDNPHSTTAAQVGALSTAGGTVTGTLQVNAPTNAGSALTVQASANLTHSALGIYSSVSAAAGEIGSIYGLYSVASSSSSFGTAYGLYSTASSVLPGNFGAYAGYFAGNVVVSGTLSKSAGSFLIDHPLDPHNKTLRHGFVESPEDLCLYRGKVTLDETGRAMVTMPDYFAALTKEKDATVNLTPVGEKPFLTSYKWNEAGTEFTICGEANGVVTYLVLADRDDPAIRLLRRPVEEEKREGHFEKGKFICPQAYGMPAEAGFGAPKA